MTDQLEAPLEIDGPDDEEVSDGEDEEEKEEELEEAEFTSSAVVKDGLFPVRQTVDEHVVIPATQVRDM